MTEPTTTTNTMNTSKLQEAIADHERKLSGLLDRAATQDPETAVAVAIAIAHASVSLRARADITIGRLLQAHPDAGSYEREANRVGRRIRRRLSTRRRVLHDLVILARAVDDPAAKPEQTAAGKKRIAPTPGGYPDGRTVTRPWVPEQMAL